MNPRCKILKEINNSMKIMNINKLFNEFEQQKIDQVSIFTLNLIEYNKFKFLIFLQF